MKFPTKLNAMRWSSPSPAKRRWLESFAILVLVFLPCSVNALLGPGFIENKGQVDSRVFYYGRFGGGAVYFTTDSIVFDLLDPSQPASVETEFLGENLCPAMPQRGCVVRVRFNHDTGSARIEGRNELPLYYNFFRGRDETNWQSHVPAFREIIYHEVRPGVDVIFGTRGGKLTYRLVSSPSNGSQRIAFDYAGIDAIDAGDDCELLRTPVGTLVHSPPDGEEGVGTFLFDVLGAGGIDGVLDESDLVWSTFLGGDDRDDIGKNAIALDSSGNPVLTGTTKSSDFPTTEGVYDTLLNGTYDAFVAKLEASGDSLLWGTYLGGGSNDQGWALSLDSSGNVLLTGYTTSSDFPTTGAADDTSYNGSGDAFVAKLSGSGSSLSWSTYLGGEDLEYPWDLSIDSSSDVLVVGYTASSDFPTEPTNVYDTSYNGGSHDVFVTKVNSDGSSLEWSTFIGGDDTDWGFAIDLDDSGDPVVAGSTESEDFPTTRGAVYPNHSGGHDAFVTKLNSSGTAVLNSTFLGGSNNDFCFGLELDGSDNPVLAGEVWSTDFPTTDAAFDTTHNGGVVDAFAAKLSSTLTSLTWSTFLGGSSWDEGRSVALNAFGSPVVGGTTGSSNFPMATAGYDTTHNGSNDAFVVKLNSAGSSLLWSTFLGGEDSDQSRALILAGTGGGYAITTGWTDSDDFPTTSAAYDTTLDGSHDAFVSKLEITSLIGIQEDMDDHVALNQDGSQGTEHLTLNDSPMEASVAVFNNPSSADPVIVLRLARDVDVEVRIHNVRGELVRRLVSGSKSAGTHRFVWDGRDESGRSVSSGQYFALTRMGNQRQTQRLILIR